MHEVDLRTNYFHLEEQPSLIKNGQLRGYQIEGVSWLVNLRNSGLHGILADEMGLGKTLQCISLLAYLSENCNINGPHLIVVPKSTIINWNREFNKWCPSFKVLALEAPNKEERNKLIKQTIKGNQLISHDIVICSYEICMICCTKLRKIEWNYIIVDEAHRLKNDASKFSKILRTFTSSNRLLVTGTPLQNNLRELWALLNFLLPDLFNSSSDFENMFSFGNSDSDQIKIFEQLRILLKPFLLRRLKIHAASDLPPKTESILFVGMSELQVDVYKKVLMRELNTIVHGKNTRSLLNLVMQLRKVTNHPYLFDGVEDLSLNPFGEHLIANSGKLCLLDKLLPRLKAQGSRCLIFSQMTRVLDILEDYAHIRSYKYCRIDGSTSGEDRQEQMDRYNADGSEDFLFLLTTRAGGLGINLQTADIVIIFDSDWNPQMDLQAMDRVHRIGQTKPVKVYRLVTKGTVEERILERAELKLRLDAMVIQRHRKNNNTKNNDNGKGNLAEMVEYGAQQIFKLKGSTITDDDIEAILDSGESETAKLKDQWEKASKKDFSELTLEFNYQTYDGCDYTEQRKLIKKQNDAKLHSLATIIGENMGNKSARLATQFGTNHRKNRNKNVSYNVDQYYRERINNYGYGGGGNHNHNPNGNSNDLIAPQKLPDIRYWQFYKAERLYELHKKEWDFFNKWKSSVNYDKEIHFALTEEEKLEKEEILNVAFPMMSYRDFGHFVRSCIANGKDNIDMIVQDLNEYLNEDVVRRYHNVFFNEEMTAEIGELESHLQRIELNEQKRILRNERMIEKEKRDLEKKIKKEKWEQYKLEMKSKKEEKKRKLEEKLKLQTESFVTELNERITKCIDGDWYNELVLPDAKGKDIGFDKEIDKCLFVLTHKIGYGKWKKIHEKLLKNPLFQFNFLMQIQTPNQIKHRIDTILRACVAVKNKKKRKLKAINSTSNSPTTNQSATNSIASSPPIKKRKIENDQENDANSSNTNSVAPV